MADWSDRVCNKLEEAVVSYNLKTKKGQHTPLSKVAEQCHVPYPHLLLWFVK